MRRVLGAAALTIGLLLASAVPAFAHAELDHNTAEAGKEIDLVLTVPSEVDGAANSKIVLELPAGFGFRNCIATGNWACSLSSEGTPARDVITWAPVPGNTQGIETFQFRVEAPPANGTSKFEVNQFYSNGDVVNWDGAPDSDNPAPTITATGGTGIKVDPPAAQDDAEEGDGGEVAQGADAEERSDNTAKGDDSDHAEEPSLGSGAEASGDPAAAADSEKKDTNYMGLYIIIAFWLIVAIPVLVAGTKGGKVDGHGHAEH